MINLDTDSTLTKWFVWSCDHLPFTGTRDYGEGKPQDGERRRGAYYVERGTTLCHLFWAMLWVPLLAVAVATGILVLFVAAHVGMAHSPVKDQFICGLQTCRQMTYVDEYGVLSYFFLEGMMLTVVAGVALLFTILFGASKVGFFGLLWQYLKGIKQHVCPLVRFGGHPQAAE